MSWVKRNLYFLISSVVAVALLGLAGYYFYGNYTLNDENRKKLYDAYDELDQLIRATPNPGNKDVDNIAIAREQRGQVLEEIDKERQFFLPIPPIPASTNITKDEFASALRRTVEDLQNSAATASVTVPSKYNFSFQAQRDLTIFALGSLPPLSEKLGEVKAICRVLFQAKVNSLDNLRRERVSVDDLNGPSSDYLDNVSVTNQLAVMTPYEVTFHCFSPELAGVLSGFANDPHGIVVKAINVQPGTTEATHETGAAGGFFPGMPVPPHPLVTKGGLPVMLDEKQLKVTLALEVIKLLPKK
jgi:hypothetical protein